MDIQLHPRVVELIASRICHDLVSPVGAVSNGVELMQELGEAAGGEAEKLVADSAHQAGIRLKAFRLCYGAAGTDKNVGFKEIRETFSDLLSSGRVTAEFAPDLAQKFSTPPRGFYKCLLNLFILAEECNHGEGRIHVGAVETPAEGETPARTGIRVLVTGRNPAFRDGAEAALKGETPMDDLDPRLVHAYITGRFAAWFDLHLSWQAAPGAGRLEFTMAY
jgi:histidine phosphotransferase ChpT